MSRVFLTDICSSIVDCVNKTAPTVDFETPYKMLRTSNIKNGQIHIDDLKCVTQEVYKKWCRRIIPEAGDIILTREAPLGEVGMLKEWKNLFLGQRLMLYRVDESKANKDFVLYSFQCSNIQTQIRALASGSTVEHMRVPDAEKITIELPERLVQDQVALVLSAYDKLIDNNNRRITILEEMAQRLYREWFVHFRFPGHKNIPMVESELGMIPEGWEVSDIESCCDVLRRGISPKYNDDAVGIVINQKCIRDFSINLELARHQERVFPKELQVKNGDVLINSTGVGTLGRVAQMYRLVVYVI